MSGILTSMTIWLPSTTSEDPSIWLPDYAKAGLPSPLDVEEWFMRGVCSCGHPARRHMIPSADNPAGPVGSPEYENDDRPDICQGVVRTRQNRTRRYYDNHPERLCACRRVSVVMRVTDLRPFARECGDVNHPFNLALDALYRSKGPEKAVQGWLRPPVCRWTVEEGVRCGRTAADGHLIQMHYTSLDRSSSDWFCLEHLHQSRFGVRDDRVRRHALDALDPES